MSRQTTTVVTCDLCGISSEHLGAERFRTIDGVDLCRWCAQPPMSGVMSSGRHSVTFTVDGWVCSCGSRYRRPLLRPAHVLAAVPSLPTATANLHVEGRRL